jgi:hypothetical protein
MRRATQRGQGTVELALGSLIFLTVLFFGIHFGEIGMMKLRVQQAGASALWETTGFRTHRLDAPVGSPPQFFSAPEVRDTNGRTSEEAAQLRYQDFEGSSNGGSTTFTQVMTRGASLTVTCTPTPISPLPNTDAFNRLRASYTLPVVGGREADGMACSASAQLQVWGLPRSFQEDSRGGGFFKVAHSMVPVIQVCAFGRARGGVCDGKVLMALDDWGLAGSDPSMGRELEVCKDNCVLTGGGNQAYKRTVERLYQKYNDFGARDYSIPDFIRTLFSESPTVPELNNVPVDETTFRMAFVGEEGPDGDGSNPFAMKTREQDTRRAFDEYWTTSPYDDVYRTAYRRRGQCFLGSPCSRSYFDKSRW